MRLPEKIVVTTVAGGGTSRFPAGFVGRMIVFANADGSFEPDAPQGADAGHAMR